MGLVGLGDSRRELQAISSGCRNVPGQGPARGARAPAPLLCGACVVCGVERPARRHRPEAVARPCLNME